MGYTNVLGWKLKCDAHSLPIMACNLAEIHVFGAMRTSVDSTFSTAVSAEYINFIFFMQPKISIRSFFRC